MTGPSGNRLSICPLKFRSPLQEFLLTSATPRSIETLGEAILDLSGQIDSLLPSRPVIIFLFVYIYLYQLKNGFVGSVI